MHSTPVAPEGPRQHASQVDRLGEVLVDTLPRMNAELQRFALRLYRLLARGEPVRPEALAQAAGIAAEKTAAILADWRGVFYDESGRIVGFWGIAVRPMKHRFEVDGATAYTWCAWDALFIPHLLGATAQVTSTCADTGEAIALTVSPAGIEARQPPAAVISFIIPSPAELAKSVTTSFCHFVHFFRDRSAGERWVAQHPGTFLLCLEDAFALGVKVNQARYGSVNRNEA